MRVLTGEEVQKLESSLPGIVGSTGFWHETMRPTLVSLQRLSYIDVFEDADCVRSTTTPRGQLALRCHRAFLASKGAT